MTATWSDTKHRAIQGFNGELPNAATEQEILDAFQLEPLAVLHALDAVISDVRNGKARSGWAIWRTRVRTALTTTDVYVDTANRPAAIRTTEAWIRNAGGYIDRQSELEDELFGDLGKLRDWPDLRQRMVAYWLEQRHRFQQAEQAADMRARAQAALRAELKTRLRHATSSAVTRELGDAIAEAVAQDVTLRRDAIEQPPPIDDTEAEALAADLDTAAA